VSSALVIEDVDWKYHVVFSSVACLAQPHSLSLSHDNKNFCYENFLKKVCVLIFNYKINSLVTLSKLLIKRDILINYKYYAQIFLFLQLYIIHRASCVFRRWIVDWRKDKHKEKNSKFIFAHSCENYIWSLDEYLCSCRFWELLKSSVEFKPVEYWFKFKRLCKNGHLFYVIMNIHFPSKDFRISIIRWNSW
jgi:hypothetical protein